MNETEQEKIYQQHIQHTERKLKVVIVLFALLFLFCLWFLLSE